MTIEQEYAKLALSSYRATKNRPAAVSLMMNNSAMTESEATIAWETIDAVMCDIYDVKWHSETKNV